MSLTGKTNEEKIWNFLLDAGFTKAGAAGLIGNLNAESGLYPDRVQGDIPYSDFSKNYTKQIDEGIINENEFINNGPNGGGYGLAQWTYYTRKRSLYRFAKNLNTSIGNLETQLKFLLNELKNNYTNSVYKVLIKTDSLQEASDAVLYKFENPANASAKSTERLRLSQNTYNKFVKGDEQTMKTYARNENVKLSANFTSNEFQCHCGRCATVTIDEKLVEYLQKIREHFNAPVILNSAYRCKTHNAAVGGASGSKHVTGQAADVVVTGVAPREVAKYAESLGVKGIGLYETATDGHFVHIDTRDYKSFWYGQKQAYRSTFGGASNSGGSSSNSSSKTYKTLKKGSKGTEVKTLQQNLIALGYSLGNYGADGVYGTSTYNAVKAFQKDKKLTVDGIAGPATQKAIDEAIAANKKDPTNTTARRVQVTASGLNVRKGAGKTYPIVGIVYKGAICNVETTDGNWGKISQPEGWVDLSYTKEV